MYFEAPTFAKIFNDDIMDVITIETQAYKDLVSKINAIAKFVTDNLSDACKEETKDNDGWADAYEVCAFLNISARTLQRLRSSGAVNYSLIRGKTFYRISEIRRLLDENIIRRDDECLRELIKNSKLHVK
jgi:hypothetical protein